MLYSAADIVPLQLFSGFAFVASLYAALSCEFVYNNFDFEKAENGTKSVVGFGVYYREGFYESDHVCSSYSSLESESVFDAYFKVTVYAITFATFAGAFNFIYSVSMWFVYFGYTSLIYKVGVYCLCITCGIISQLVYLSNTCNMDECNILPNGSTGSLCFKSNCTLGKGGISIIFAIILWIVCIMASMRLIKKKKDKKESYVTNDHGSDTEIANHVYMDDIRIKQMENNESFETILYTDEDSTKDTLPEKERKQNWLRQMYKDFTGTHDQEDSL